MLLIKSSAHQTEGKLLFCPSRPQIRKLALPKQYFIYMTHHHTCILPKSISYSIFVVLYDKNSDLQMSMSIIIAGEIEVPVVLAVGTRRSTRSNKQQG